MKLAVALIALLAACGDDVDGRALVSERTSSALESHLDLAYVANSFSAPLALGPLDIVMAAPLALTEVRSSVGRLVALLDCVTVTSDDLTFIQLDFDQCEAGMLAIDGTLRAELSFETVSCPAGNCPVAAVYDLTVLDLTTQNGRVLGTGQLRAPIGIGQRLSWLLNVTLSRDEAALGVEAEGSFARTGTCVDLDWDAQLTLNERAQAELATDVSTVAASGAGIERCARMCPRAGTVSVSFGAGELVRWSYNGTGQVTATAPRGEQIALTLPCGN